MIAHGRAGSLGGDLSDRPNPCAAVFAAIMTSWVNPKNAVGDFGSVGVARDWFADLALPSAFVACKGGADQGFWDPASAGLASAGVLCSHDVHRRYLGVLRSIALQAGLSLHDTGMAVSISLAFQSAGKHARHPDRRKAQMVSVLVICAAVDFGMILCSAPTHPHSYFCWTRQCSVSFGHSSCTLSRADDHQSRSPPFDRLNQQRCPTRREFRPHARGNDHQSEDTRGTLWFGAACLSA